MVLVISRLLLHTAQIVLFLRMLQTVLQSMDGIYVLVGYDDADNDDDYTDNFVTMMMMTWTML